MISYQQKADYTCGVAVVRTLLGVVGLPVPSERWLIPRLHATDEQGTPAKRIVEYLEGHNFQVRIEVNRDVKWLRRQIRLGRAVILDWSDWGGHYVLAWEFDRPKGWSGGRFKCADPAAGYEGRPDGFTYVSGDRLQSMWFDPIPPSTKGLAIVVKYA